MLQVVYTNSSTALFRVSFIEYEKQPKKIVYMKTYKTLTNKSYTDMYCCG